MNKWICFHGLNKWISRWICSWGFPGSSASKEFACNSRDPGLIPGSGNSPGEGIVDPLQYSGASLVAQMVENASTVWETLGSIPGLGRSPEEEHGNPLQYSCMENPHGWRSLAGYSPWGCKELDMTDQLSTVQHSTWGLTEESGKIKSIRMKDWINRGLKWL